MKVNFDDLSAIMADFHRKVMAGMLSGPRIDFDREFTSWREECIAKLKTLGIDIG